MRDKCEELRKRYHVSPGRPLHVDMSFDEGWQTRGHQSDLGVSSTIVDEYLIDMQVCHRDRHADSIQQECATYVNV